MRDAGKDSEFLTYPPCPLYPEFLHSTLAFARLDLGWAIFYSMPRKRLRIGLKARKALTRATMLFCPAAPNLFG